jgi:hypothetical protein
VLIDTWPAKDLNKIYYTVVAEHAEAKGYSVPKVDISDADMLVVLDEAQMSYYDSGLWLARSYKDTEREEPGLRICLFFCYGSIISEPEFGAGSPLAHISIQQRVSVIKSDLPDSPPISLYCTRHEFNDLSNYIYRLTAMRSSIGRFLQ